MVPDTTNCPDTTATPALLVVDVEDMLGVAQPPNRTHIAKMDPSSADIVILTNGFKGASSQMEIVLAVLRDNGARRQHNK